MTDLLSQNIGRLNMALELLRYGTPSDQHAVREILTAVCTNLSYLHALAGTLEAASRAPTEAPATFQQQQTLPSFPQLPQLLRPAGVGTTNEQQQPSFPQLPQLLRHGGADTTDEQLVPPFPQPPFSQLPQQLPPRTLSAAALDEYDEVNGGNETAGNRNIDIPQVYTPPHTVVTAPPGAPRGSRVRRRINSDDDGDDGRQSRRRRINSDVDGRQSRRQSRRPPFQISQLEDSGPAITEARDNTQERLAFAVSVCALKAERHDEGQRAKRR